jgi:RNA polymerase sigma factor (sigma-70 family)
MLGDLDAAEETVQEALAAALVHWPVDGLPDNPGAWLMTVARNRARDHLRRRRRLREKVEAFARDAEAAPETVPDAADESPLIADDRLRLIFTCCHPELSPDSRVALTLRLVGGLSTGEIARAFLVSEPTIAQRLVRAKRMLRERRVPYAVPEAADLPGRLASVLAVIYLVFNEGHSAREGDRLVRPEVCEEALRLGATLVELMPAEPEARGLLALMELTAARAPGARRPGRRADPPRRSRSRALGRRADPAGARPPRGRGPARWGRLLPAPGRHRRVPCPGANLGGHRLAGHRRSLRAAHRRGPVRGRGAEPGGGGEHGGGAGSGARPPRPAREPRARRLSPSARRAG